MKTKRRTVYRALLTALFAVFISACAFAVACAGGCGGQKEHPELGVYYCDVPEGEKLLTLYDNDKFIMISGGESTPGTYSVEKEGFSLNFSDKTLGKASAVYADDVLTVTQDGGEYRYLRRVEYTVTFDTDGGSEVAAVSVVNGRSIAKPDDPQKSNYSFVGWYTDAERTTPFSFGAQAVTGDITLYARWVAQLAGGEEFTVKFDLGYDGAEAIEPQTTSGGLLFGVPEPKREGYKFLGWWISDFESREKLTSLYNETTLIEQNTTLFAEWAEGGSQNDLQVNVGASSVSWAAVPSAVSYQMVVLPSDGKSHLFLSGTTTEKVDFASMAAGECRISVKALTSSNDEVATCVRYINNKALKRVSHFSVTASNNLIFGGVEGAERYYITVVCGNDRHNHTNYDNGKSTYFNFAGCPMKAGGIEFTVTATAAGRASSVSETFRYERILSEVTGFALDESTQLLTWNAVPFAAGYTVSVNSGSGSVTFDNGGDNSLSLKEYSSAADGKITVGVYPYSKGYISPAAKSFEFAKTNLATPANIRAVGSRVVWDAVSGATGYEVNINDHIITISDAATTEADVAAYLDDGVSTYSVSVRAKGGADSLWSDEVEMTYGGAIGAVNYFRGEVSWKPVLGAAYYEVQLNDEEPVEVTGATSRAITLTRAGENVIKVRSIAEDGLTSEWLQTTVYAYEITFDTSGGTAVEPIYLAAGDDLVLPQNSNKTGYTLGGWYTAKGGADSNAEKVENGYFSGSGDTVLYAYWINVEYGVNLNYDGGGTGQTSSSAVFGKNFTLPVPASVTDGRYAFFGWFSGDRRLTDEYGNGLAVWNIPQEGATLVAGYVEAFSFTLAEDGTYSVVRGAGIGELSCVTVPAQYNGARVTSVEGYAFRNCNNLRIINLPDTLRRVETDTAFYGCTSLEEVNVYETGDINDIVYFSCDGALIVNREDAVTGEVTVTLAYFPEAKTGEYNLPEDTGVQIIPARTFSGRQISRVYLPSTVKEIASNAFANAAYLAELTIADGEEKLTLGDEAFSGCNNLIRVKLPARASLATGANFKSVFYGCNKLSSLNISDGNADYISYNGFVCNAAGALIFCPAGKHGNLVIPDGVWSIGEGVFENNKSFTSLTISGTVSEIGDRAFKGCGFTSVKFNASVLDVSIGEEAFADNPNLGVLTFDDGAAIVSIGKRAFTGTALGNGMAGALTLPASLTLIDEEAFAGLSTLRSVTFTLGADLTLKARAFADSGLQKLEIPASVVGIDAKTFDGCTALTELTVDPANTHFAAADNVLFNSTMTSVLFFPYNKTEITLPDSVTEIGAMLFMGRKQITKVVIGANVQSIGNAAFANSGLTEVEFTESQTPLTIANGSYQIGAFSGTQIENITLPDRLISIGAFAFYDTPVKSINIPAKTTFIGRGAFANTPQLTSLTFSPSSDKLTLENGENSSEGVFADSGITNDEATPFEIPQRITEISAFAFFGSSLKSVKIHQNVTKIGKGAFAFGYPVWDGTGELNYNKLLQQYDAAPKSPLKRVIFENPSATEPALEIEDGENFTEGAFANAAIEGTEQSPFTLPARLTIIGAYAFSNHIRDNGSTDESAQLNKTPNRLRAVAFESGSKLQKIGNYAFASKLFSATGRGANPYNYVLRSVTLPEGLTEIGRDAFSYAIYLQSINIPSTVKTIRSGAFANCSSVTSLTFASGGSEPLTIEDTSDDYGTFGHLNISSLQLPERLEYIGYLAFAEDKISTVSIPASVTAIGNAAFMNCNIQTLNFASYASGGKLREIGGQAFRGNAFTSINIPGSVERLGATAFGSCKSLNGVTFEESPVELTVMPSYGTGGLFDGCDSITSLTLPARLKSLGNNSLVNMTGLQTVIFSEGGDNEASALELGNNIFDLSSGESKLTELNLPKRVSSLSQATFAFTSAESNALQAVNVTEGGAHYSSQDGILYDGQKTKLIYCPPKKEAFSLTLPQSVTDIEANAFNRTEITGIIFPADCALEEIPDYAFNGAGNLSEITFPQNLKKIGENAFAGTQISELTLPDTVTEIGNSAFLNTKITTLKIPASVQRIGSNAFAINTLTEVDFSESTVTSFGYSPFSGSLISSISVPSSVTEIGTLFSGLGSLTEINFPDDFKVTAFERGLFSGCSSLTGLKIPASVITLGEKFMLGAGTKENPVDVTFDENTTISTIGGFAFASDDYVVYKDGGEMTFLKSIEIPATVSTIEYRAFVFSQTLESVTFKESANGTGATVLTITPEAIEGADGAFRYCSKLGEITLPARTSGIGGYTFSYSSVTKVTMTDNPDPEFSLIIGANAFGYAPNLTEITFSANVEQIGDSVLQGCESLNKVTFNPGCKVSSLPIEAFYETPLKELVLPDGLQRLNDIALDVYNEYQPDIVASHGALSGVELESLTLSAGLQSLEGIENFASVLRNIQTITVSAQNPVLSAEDSVVYSGNTIAYYPINKTGDLTLKSTVTTIAPNAFRESKITDVNFNGAAITSIGANAFRGSAITEITLPASLTYLGIGALADCAALESVVFEGAGVTALSENLFAGSSLSGGITLPSGLTSIGMGAFGGSNLPSITIPNTVTEIGEGAFAGCEFLTQLTFVEGGTDNLIISSGDTSASGAFAGTALSGDVTFPARISEIGDFAFFGTSFSSVNFAAESRLTKIGASAFTRFNTSTSSAAEANGVLTSITFPAGLTSIGAHAFARCVGVTGVEIPANVITIGAGAFFGCTQLDSLTFGGTGGNPLDIAGGSGASDGAFANTALTAINLPSRLKTLGGYAFYCDNSGTAKPLSLTIPQDATLESIGDYAFSGNGFTSVTLPERLLSIGAGAFANAENLALVAQTGNMLLSIGDGAFRGDIALTAFEFRSGLKSIGADAFRSSGLQSAALPATLESLGANAFMDCANLASVSFAEGSGSLELPDSTGSGYGLFAGTALSSVTLSNRISKIGSYAFYGLDGIQSVTIPAGVITIGDYAFAECGDIKITLADLGKLQVIGSYAFAGADMGDIVLPSSLSDIGAHAFDGAKMTSLFISASVEEIGSYAFANAEGLLSVDFGENAAVSVAHMGEGAFYNCNELTSMIVPGKFISIGASAFENCSALTDISIGRGTQTIGARAFAGCSSAKVSLPDTITELGVKALDGASEVSVAQGNSYYTEVEGLVYNAAKTELIFVSSTASGNIVLPDTLIKIDDGAFANRLGISSVYIPVSVTQMGAGVFAGWHTPMKIRLEGAAVPESWGTAWRDGMGNGLLEYNAQR